jgi:hypothetical protein
MEKSKETEKQKRKVSNARQRMKRDDNSAKDKECEGTCHYTKKSFSVEFQWFFIVVLIYHCVRNVFISISICVRIHVLLRRKS